MQALFEDERALAEKYWDEKGINWAEYWDKKNKAGYSKKKAWEFFDSREIFVQIDSQWLKPMMKETDCIWYSRIEGKRIRTNKCHSNYKNNG